MSWQEYDLMSLRKEFVLQARKGHMPFSTLCRQHQISRKTGYKWMSRHEDDGEQGLRNQSTRPNSSPKETNEDLVDKILEVRKKHPCWGGRKIQAWLNRKEVVGVPATSTINSILKRHGCIGQQSKNKPAFQRFEHDAPNHLWQMDFKGHFAYERGRCHPLTILDDHSRFSIKLNACQNERLPTVKTQLIDTFKEYGLPERINVDNGSPWGSLFEACRYTSLTVWLIEHGVKVSYSRPYHPQTNGKLERFHRTLKAELLQPTYFRDLNMIQKSFDQWRDCYNLERPHEALDMSPPIERYHRSYRCYQDQIEHYEYAADYSVSNTDKRGRLHFEGRQIFIGVPFSQRVIGIRETKIDGQIKLFYRQQRLGVINLNDIKKGTMINLYSGGLLST